MLRLEEKSLLQGFLSSTQKVGRKNDLSKRTSEDLVSCRVFSFFVRDALPINGAFVYLDPGTNRCALAATSRAYAGCLELTTHPSDYVDTLARAPLPQMRGGGGGGNDLGAHLSTVMPQVAPEALRPEVVGMLKQMLSNAICVNITLCQAEKRVVEAVCSESGISVTFRACESQTGGHLALVALREIPRQHLMSTPPQLHASCLFVGSSAFELKVMGFLQLGQFPLLGEGCT